MSSDPMAGVVEVTLSEIMTRRVETIASDATLQTAARRMADSGLTSLVVTREARPVGLLTARDLAGLRTRGVGYATPVGEVVARTWVSAAPEQDYRSAYVQLRRAGIRHMTVVDASGMLVGLVTETDIYRRLGSDLLRRIEDPQSVIERDVPRLGPGDPVAQAMSLLTPGGKEFVLVVDAERPIGILTERDLPPLLSRPGEAILATPLAEVMSVPLVTLVWGGSMTEALELMDRHGIRHLPLVEERDGRLVGVLSQHRLLDWLGLTLLERTLEERQDLRRAGSDLEGRLDMALDAAGMGVWEYDNVRGLNTWEERLCRITGYDRAPPSLHDWLALVHPRDRPRVLDRIQDALGGADYYAEYRLLHANGDWIWCESRGRVVRRGAQGEPLLTTGVMVDISKRKGRELELRRLHATLNALVEGTPDVVFVKDRAGRYVMANQAAARLIGRSVDQVLGQTDLALFPRELAERFRADDRRIMGSGLAETYTEPVETVGGRFDYLVTKGPLVIAGEVRGVFGIARDVSDRRQAERALQQSELRLKEAQRIAQVGHWEIDPAGPALVWSEEMYRITGFDPALGPPSWKTYLQSVHPEDRQRVEEAQREVLRTGKPARTVHRNNPARGPVRHFIRRVEPEMDEAGRIVRLVGTCQDVTDLHEAEARARRSDAMLDSVFQAIPDLFFLMDGDGTVRDYRAQRGSGLYMPPEEFLGKRAQDVLPPRLADTFEEKLRAALAQDAPVLFEYDLDMPGRDRRFEARLSRLGDSGQCIAVVRDITEQYRAREALAESERRYSLAAAIGRSGAWELWPLEGKLFFDHNLTRLMGYERGDLSENLADWLAVAVEISREQIQEALRAIVEGRADTLTVEYQVRRKDGSTGWIYLTGERVSPLGDEPLRVVGSSLDITERKRSEIERNAQLEELRRWHEVMLGRETRVLELKEEVNALLAELGRAPRYPSVSGEGIPSADV